MFFAPIYADLAAEIMNHYLYTRTGGTYYTPFCSSHSTLYNRFTEHLLHTRVWQLVQRCDKRISISHPETSRRMTHHKENSQEIATLFALPTSMPEAPGVNLTFVILAQGLHPSIHPLCMRHWLHVGLPIAKLVAHPPLGIVDQLFLIPLPTITRSPSCSAQIAKLC